MVDHSRIPARDQLARMLDELRTALDDLEEGVKVDTDGRTDSHKGERTPNIYEMLQLLAAAKRDGFPARSMSDGESRTAYDDKGEPMPLVSDPTGETVIAPASNDPMFGHMQSVARGIACALGDARIARAAMIRASQFAESRPAEPGCSSCARIGSWMAVEDNGRCRWCYDFWLAEGIEPPVELLKARGSGKRITRQMVEESMTRRPKKGRRAVPA